MDAAAKLIQETLESPEFFGKGVQVLTAESKGKTWEGTFRERSSRKVFSYTIGNNTVKYQPIKARADGWDDQQHLDAWDTLSRQYLGSLRLDDAKLDHYDSNPDNFTNLSV